MNLKNYCWTFPSVLSQHLCDSIVKYGTMHQEQLALTGTYGNKKADELNQKELKDLKKLRDSNIVWLDDTWIYKEIHPYINLANKESGWNFEWNYSERCQFTKYKLNQYYDWHVDSWSDPYTKNNDHEAIGKIRKLSVTCSLSDPNDYVGGELEIYMGNKHAPNSKKRKEIYACKEVLPRGSICVFPSFVWHRVKPVTKGTRYSLVIWNLGYPFK
jgi:PKHD-type hydroxylase